jgi:hypothetical protein
VLQRGGGRSALIADFVAVFVPLGGPAPLGRLGALELLAQPGHQAPVSS